MDESDVGQIIVESLELVLIASSPILFIALGIGLFVAFFQALTQIQEMTLTFVPKIVAILIALMIFLPFMYGQLSDFSYRIFDIITSGGL